MPTPIRAAVCRGFNQPLTIETLQLAEPDDAQVQVRILASAICHSDIHFFDGAWGGQLPAVWGHEAAGVVEAVGEGVDDVAIGDRVVVTLIRSCGQCRNCLTGTSVACLDAPAHPSPLTGDDGEVIAHGLGTGCFAERTVVDRSQIVVIDPSVAMAPASLLACGVITGVGAACNSADIHPGASVVVVGTGGVGLNAVQGARLAGATVIVAVDLDDEKLSVATTFGATHTVNPRTSDLGDAVGRITDGRMADHVLVTVGAAGPIEQAPQLLAPNGEVVIVGMPSSGVTVTIDPVTLAAVNQRIIGSKMGTSTIANDIPELLTRYESGELLLDELITRTYTLEQINEAIADVVDGSALRNVIVFDEEG